MHNKDRFPHSSTPQNAAPVTSAPIVLSRRSLNSEVRRKELMKITIENQTMLKRLQDKTSNYSVMRWEEDYKQTEKLMKSMCEYPFVLVNNNIDNSGDKND